MADKSVFACTGCGKTYYLKSAAEREACPSCGQAALKLRCHWSRWSDFDEDKRQKLIKERLAEEEMRVPQAPEDESDDEAFFFTQSANEHQSNRPNTDPGRLAFGFGIAGAVLFAIAGIIMFWSTNELLELFRAKSSLNALANPLGWFFLGMACLSATQGCKSLRK